MQTFKLIIEEVTVVDGEYTDRQLSKDIQHPIVPRQGEIMYISGNGYPVNEVEHNIDTGAITVLVSWDEIDFSVLWDTSAANSWTQITQGN